MDFWNGLSDFWWAVIFTILSTVLAVLIASPAEGRSPRSWQDHRELVRTQRAVDFANPYTPDHLNREYAEMIVDATGPESLGNLLLVAIGWQESGFSREDLKSHAGAVGVMQLTHHALAALGLPWEPRRLRTDHEWNIEVADRYLIHLYQKRGARAVQHYYAGYQREEGLWYQEQVKRKLHLIHQHLKEESRVRAVWRREDAR